MATPEQKGFKVTIEGAFPAIDDLRTSLLPHKVGTIAELKPMHDGARLNLDPLAAVSLGISLYSLFFNPIIPTIRGALSRHPENRLRVSSALGSVELDPAAIKSDDDLLKALQPVLPLSKAANDVNSSGST